MHSLYCASESCAPSEVTFPFRGHNFCSQQSPVCGQSAHTKSCSWSVCSHKVLFVVSLLTASSVMFVVNLLTQSPVRGQSAHTKSCSWSVCSQQGQSCSWSVCLQQGPVRSQSAHSKVSPVRGQSAYSKVLFVVSLLTARSCSWSVCSHKVLLVVSLLTARSCSWSVCSQQGPVRGQSVLRNRFHDKFAHKKSF